MLDGSTQVPEAVQIECAESDLRTIDRNLKRIAKRRRELDHEEAEWLLKAERARAVRVKEVVACIVFARQAAARRDCCC